MHTPQTSDPETIELERELLGINAKTSIVPPARSWSGGRRRIVGKGAMESYCYHVMSRTCGDEVLFDNVKKEALRRLLWKMAEFSGVRLVTYCIEGPAGSGTVCMNGAAARLVSELAAWGRFIRSSCAPAPATGRRAAPA